MSRSSKRVPIAGATMARSDKAFKVQEHQRARRAARVALSQGSEAPHPKEYGDPWCGPKDGKRWHSDPDVMRK